MPNEVIQIGAARQQIKSARTPEEALGMAKKIDSIISYLLQSNHDIDLANPFAEASVRAKRKAGELLDSSTANRKRGRPRENVNAVYNL